PPAPPPRCPRRRRCRAPPPSGTRARSRSNRCATASSARPNRRADGAPRAAAGRSTPRSPRPPRSRSRAGSCANPRAAPPRSPPAPRTSAPTDDDSTAPVPPPAPPCRAAADRRSRPSARPRTPRSRRAAPTARRPRAAPPGTRPRTRARRSAPPLRRPARRCARPTAPAAARAAPPAPPGASSAPPPPPPPAPRRAPRAAPRYQMVGARMRAAEPERRRRQLRGVEPVGIGCEARDVRGEGDEEDEESERASSLFDLVGRVHRGAALHTLEGADHVALERRVDAVAVLIAVGHHRRRRAGARAAGVGVGERVREVLAVADRELERGPAALLPVARRAEVALAVELQVGERGEVGHRRRAVREALVGDVARLVRVLADVVGDGAVVHLAQVHGRFDGLGAADVLHEGGDRDRRQDADDGNDDHELDEGEPSDSAHQIIVIQVTVTAQYFSRALTPWKSRATG